LIENEFIDRTEIQGSTLARIKFKHPKQYNDDTSSQGDIFSRPSDLRGAIALAPHRARKITLKKIIFFK
jgi:hypothetical protein